MKQKYLFWSLFWLNFPLFAQTKISFLPVFEGKVCWVSVENEREIGESDSIFVEMLRFYVSDFALLHKDSVVWKAANSVHLIDLAKPQSLSFCLEKTENIVFDKLQFNLGIDSLTHVSGAMGGDLDPTKGMYWTWQSGYINLKLEGKNWLCKTRNNEFQFHLGGYQMPNNALQRLSFSVENKQNIEIQVPIADFFNAIDLSKQAQIMSPSREAVLLAKKWAAVISVR